MFFKDACEFTSKPRGLRILDFEQIPFVPMELIPERTLYSSKFVLKDPNLVGSGTYFEAGDILLAKITPSFENGKQTIVTDMPLSFGVGTTEVIPFRERAGVSDKTFLFFYLLRPDVRAELAAKMEGTTGRQRLNKGSLENLPIALPPIVEQRIIAEVIETVQKAKETRLREMSIEQERKSALMEFLFSHGTRGEVRKQTEVGEIPESWQLERLCVLYKTQLGKMLSQKARVGVNPKPYLRNANVQWGRVALADVYKMDFSESEQEKFRLRCGDLLVCEGGEIGRTALWDGELPECYFQKAIHRVRPRSTEAVPQFLLQWMEWAFRVADIYGVTGTQTTIPHLPQEKLEEIKIPNPSTTEQQEIASVLSACDTAIAVLNKEVFLLDELFRATIEELMTGRLRCDALVLEGY